ncbi:hypothetical protein A2714_00960 [Candidatus Woesebacteria bacterium RIFCSPHIGHO2_01_FULL_38_9]|nr:MAG: hypothetical protein A2714_00960 [Candidatus Woesebacteria bacterium RIFCSPHIGHO2_01_FULL_38_9]
MLKVLLVSKNRLLFSLVILSLLAILTFHNQLLALTSFLLIVFSALILEFVLERFSKLNTFNYRGAITSSLIIFLLADPTAKIYQILIAIFAAVLLSIAIQSNNRPIFNKAASGLLVASFFGLPITWWGFIPGFISSLVIIILVSFMNLSIRRQLRIITPFLAVTMLFSFLSSFDIFTTVIQFLIGGFWFFTLVILPEENTAGHYTKTKIAYGILVALLAFLIPRIGFTTDPLLTSLLVANLVIWYLEKQKFSLRFPALKFLKNKSRLKLN